MGIFVFEEAATGTGAFAFGAESDWAYTGTKPKAATITMTRTLARHSNVVFLKAFLPFTQITPLNGRGVE